MNQNKIVPKKETNPIDISLVLVDLFQKGYGEMTVKDLLDLLREGVSLE
ncbi:MAG: hypothetical protein NWF06_00690 [Candidatus Bathyarchaeota archaeon]|nr:hypothetical protein [Candidatus Bathyarchaeum sp.]